eukprot:scaffold48970_cov66-Phaeocystis_antarctica.AAC.2
MGPMHVITWCVSKCECLYLRARACLRPLPQVSAGTSKCKAPGGSRAAAPGWAVGVAAPAVAAAATSS